MKNNYEIKLNLCRIISNEYNRAECTGSELDIEKLVNRIYDEVIKPIHLTSKEDAGCNNCGFGMMCEHSPYGICKDYAQL